MQWPCREAHPEGNLGHKAPSLEKLQPPGGPLSDLESLFPSRPCLTSPFCTPQLPRPQVTAAEVIPILAHPSPSSRVSTAYHPLSVLPRHPYPALADEGRGVDLAAELVFLGCSHLLTILSSFLPSRTATCTYTCAGQITPMFQAQCTPRTRLLASSWVQVGSYSGLYSLREAPVSWVGTEGHEPGTLVCPSEAVYLLSGDRSPLETLMVDVGWREGGLDQ